MVLHDESKRWRRFNAAAERLANRSVEFKPDPDLVKRLGGVVEVSNLLTIIPVSEIDEAPPLSDQLSPTCNRLIRPDEEPTATPQS